MNRPVRPRKTLRYLWPAAGLLLLSGCASNWPYYGDDGVYYGSSHGGYGYDYGYPHGYSTYRYDAYYYDYNGRYRYRPYGYGYYYGRRGHDHHDRDRHVRHEGDGNAAEELRRITRDQPRVRLDPPRQHPGRVEREKRDGVVATEAPRRDPAPREQLRRQRGNTPAPAAPAPRPAPRVESDNRHREGGIVTPRERR